MLFIPIALTTNNVPLTFLSLLQIKYALDHEGRAVGVAALWGYFINFDDYNDTISVTYNTVLVTNSIFREEPFRGIATARQTQSLLAMT